MPGPAGASGGAGQPSGNPALLEMARGLGIDVEQLLAAAIQRAMGAEDDRTTAGDARVTSQDEGSVPWEEQEAPQAETTAAQGPPRLEPTAAQAVPHVEPTTAQGAPQVETTAAQEARQVETTAAQEGNQVGTAAAQEAPQAETTVAQKAPQTEKTAAQEAPQTETTVARGAHRLEPTTAQGAPHAEPTTAQGASQEEPTAAQGASQAEPTAAQGAPQAETATQGEPHAETSTQGEPHKGTSAQGEPHAETSTQGEPHAEESTQGEPHAETSAQGEPHAKPTSAQGELQAKPTATREERRAETAAAQGEPQAEPTSAQGEPHAKPTSAQGEPQGEPTATQEEPHAETAATQRQPHAETAAAQGEPQAEPTSTQGAPQAKPTSAQGAPQAKPTSAQGEPQAKPASTQGAPQAKPTSEQGEPRARPTATQGEPHAETSAQGEPQAEPTSTQGASRTKPTSAQGEPQAKPTSAQGEPQAKPTSAQGEPQAKPTSAQGETQAQPTSAQGEPQGEPTSAQGAPQAKPASAQGAPQAKPTSAQGAPQAKPILAQRELKTEPTSAQGEPQAKPTSAQGEPQAVPTSTQGEPQAKPTSTQGTPQAKPTSAQGEPQAKPTSAQGEPHAETAAAQEAPQAKKAVQGALQAETTAQGEPQAETTAAKGEHESQNPPLAASCSYSPRGPLPSHMDPSAVTTHSPTKDARPSQPSQEDRKAQSLQQETVAISSNQGDITVPSPLEQTPTLQQDPASAREPTMGVDKGRKSDLRMVAPVPSPRKIRNTSHEVKAVLNAPTPIPRKPRETTGVSTAALPRPVPIPRKSAGVETKAIVEAQVEKQAEAIEINLPLSRTVTGVPSDAQQPAPSGNKPAGTREAERGSRAPCATDSPSVTVDHCGGQRGRARDSRPVCPPPTPEQSRDVDEPTQAADEPNEAHCRPSVTAGPSIDVQPSRGTAELGDPDGGRKTTARENFASSDVDSCQTVPDLSSPCQGNLPEVAPVLPIVIHLDPRKEEEALQDNGAQMSEPADLLAGTGEDSKRCSDVADTETDCEGWQVARAGGTETTYVTIITEIAANPAATIATSAHSEVTEDAATEVTGGEAAVTDATGAADLEVTRATKVAVATEIDPAGSTDVTAATAADLSQAATPEVAAPGSTEVTATEDTVPTSTEITKTSNTKTSANAYIGVTGTPPGDVAAHMAAVVLEAERAYVATPVSAGGFGAASTELIGACSSDLIDTESGKAAAGTDVIGPAPSMLGALAPPAGPEAGHSITQDMGAMLQKLMSLPVPSDPPGSPRRSGSAIVTPSVEDVSVEAQRSRETGSETTVAKLSLSEPHPSATPTPEEWSGSGFPQCHGDGHPRSKQVPGGQRWTFPLIVHRTTRSRAKSKRKAKLAAAGGGRSGQRPADAEPSASGSGHSTQSGHRNDLLLRSSDTFTLHLVYPADCSNNCTIRHNHVEASQTDFTEEDGGKSIFRCVDGTDCVCPVSDQAVAFPVAALDFDSFERMHHIKTRNCRICRPGLGLARAAITGRMRLIYEQSSTVEPEQVVFRIWEHEGGRTAEPADKQPPATNTLVTVERTSDRVLKPAEYEALFSVLIDLRRVQSVHVFSWMVWTSNDYFDIREMVDDLKDAGLLALDRDGKLRASGSCRCDGGLRATAADVYPELNMLNLHTLERTSKKFAKGETKKKRIQGLFGMMDDVVAGKHADVDWESLLKYNDPSSEEAYLDIPKSRTQHEMLTDYGRRSEPGTLLNKFLQGLYEVSDLNVTAVCCAWKLRKSLGDVVRDRARAHRSALRRSTTTDQPVRENSPLDDAVRGNNVYVSLRDIVPSRTGATNPSTAAPKSSAASHAQQEGTSSESSAIVRDDSDVKALAAAGKAEWHVSKGPTTNSPARSPTPPEDERALATTLQQYLTSSSLSRVSSLDSGCPAAEGGSQGDRSAAASSDTPPSSHSGLTSPSGHERPAGSDEARGSDSDATGADSEPPPEVETPPDQQHPHDSKASSDLGVLTTDSDMNGVGLSQTKGQGDSTAADYVSEGRHEQEAMPQRRPEHEDAPHQDEDVLSDSSTLRGSASSVSKDSRRRSSSGDFSEASDLDDSGSAFSKSFSPSKGQGHVGRESQDEVRSPGERIRPLIIPEEENSSEAEAPSNLRDDGRKTVPEQMSGHEARPGHAECTAGDTTKDVQGKRLIPPSSRPSTGGTSKDAAGVKSEPQNMKTGESDKMEAAASQARDDAERPPAIDVDETADTIKTLVEACMAGNHDALSQYLEQAKMEMSGQRSLAIIGHQTLLEERTYVRCYRYAINLTTDYSTQNSGGDAWLTGAETGEDSFGASRTELTSASVKDFATVRATSGDVFMAVDLCSEGVPAIPETPEVSKDDDLQSNVAAATAEGGSLWPSEDSPNEYSEEDTTHYFGLNSIIQRQQIKRTRQARFLCRQLINQPGQYINCMCMFQIQQEHTHRLRSLLDEMLKKGRFFAFLEHQDNAIGHVCKNSVMATVWEARKAREERIEHLQDYMIVLGLNQNPSVHSRFFCTPGKHENVTGAKTSRTDGTESASERQLAEITPEKCSLRVCKHHLKQIASPKCFFDVTRRDPVTHMSLHEELLSKALRTSGQTPYEMFTSVYITQKLLRTLCEACNRYLRGGKRRDQPCRKISEGEMRLFILQMVYLASRHSVHKRWDRAPRGRRCSRTPVTPPVAEEPHETADTGDPERSLSTDQPSRPREDCTNEDLAQGNATEDPDQSAPAAGSGPQRGSPEPTKRGANGGDGPASRGRANPARLRRCMTRTRFGEIADSWCAFDFCEQPQDVSRLEALREAIDVLMGSAPVAARPALLAAATRPVRCRWDRHRLAAVSLVMDGKRYVHDVVVSASLGPFMALRAGQDVLENAKRRTARTGKAGGSKDGGAMKRIYYIDGMTIEEAKTWTKDGLHCMTPIRPDDELSRLFSDMSFEHAQYVSPDGSEHGLAFGRREKSSFFLRHGAPTGRRLIMSSVHALDADGCRDAVRHVEETHRAVRDAARPIETRLNCDSHPRLRYYHKIFLRALSAAMQNVFVAQGLASGRRFDESPEALDAFCLAQFESLLEDLVDLLEKAPRENTRRVGPGVPWIGEDYQLIIRRTQLTHDMLRDDEERDD